VKKTDDLWGYDRVVAFELSGEPCPDSTPPRSQDHWLHEPPTDRDLVGLALSGGGVRSATFNLGLLQGMERVGLLRHFDYLSTVSGGGYIGGFWTAYRHRKLLEGADEEECRFVQDAPHAQGHTSLGLEQPEIKHLRRFSNFLSPRLGALSYDTGRLVVHTMGAMLPALMTTLSLIAMAMAVYLLVAWALFQENDLLSFSTLAVAVFAIQALSEATWRRQEVPIANDRARRRANGAFLLGTACALAGLLFSWWVLREVLGLGLIEGRASFGIGTADPRLPVDSDAGLTGDWLRLFAPAAALASSLVILMTLRWLGSPLAHAGGSRIFRVAYDRALSRLMYPAVGWVLLSGLWCLGVYLVRDRHLGSLGTAAVTGALFAFGQRMAARQPSRPAGVSLLDRLRPLLPQVLAYTTIAAMVIGVCALVVLAAEHDMWLEFWAIAGSSTLLTLFVFDPNLIGLHAFYRSRIARAYLGASNKLYWDPPQSEEVDDDDIALNHLGVVPADPADPGPHPSNRRDLRPLHLICCAANDLQGAGHLSNLHRGAISAVLSPVGFSVGDDWRAWTADEVTPTLGNALTASAAAFNSQMGARSMRYGPAVTFLMAAFNLRLGLWWPHPKEKKLKPRSLIGTRYYKELFGRTDARGTEVHLSDGGHFENMALYELIRRHCRYIVVSDCGQDPEVAFDDFGNVVRRVREDFGVEIRINLWALRPEADGLARQSMVAGDIHYPNGDTGILLYFKPTLVGDEPPDVTQYRARNEVFPHESTVDQFYDEAQWESYRQLGEHAASTAFRFMARDDDAAQMTPSHIFARARFTWPATPRGYEQTLSRMTEKVQALESLLSNPEVRRLRTEVFKEVAEFQRGFEPSASEAVATPSEGEVASSFQVLRQASLFMHELYHAAELEQHHGHPLNLGAMNYVARWAYAPQFRTWWPVLRTLYSRGFTRFMERHFHLPSGMVTLAAELAGSASWDDLGFAAKCWTREHGSAATANGRRVIAYRLGLPREDAGEPHYIQAGLVRVALSDGCASWDARDFYVPPGLWGVGIGRDFLRLLTDQASWPTDTRPRRLRVRIRGTAEQSASERKSRANEAQLYVTSGFRFSDGRSEPADAPGEHSSFLSFHF